MKSGTQTLATWGEHLGGIGMLAGQCAAALFAGRFESAAVVEQIDAIGLGSVSIAVLTSVFSSMVMAVQFAVQLARFGAQDYTGNVVSLSLVRELGPALTALMVGGRVGSGIAAELGSMKVGEQLDAMRSMGADPVGELVVPRVLATLVVLPLLTAFAEALGVAGAMVISRFSLHINMTYFFNATLRSVTPRDFSSGLIKTLFFALIVSLVACHRGLTVEGGTAGVGRATTLTVVIASISILISDFILTSILLAFNF